MQNVSDDKPLPITMPMELKIPNALVFLRHKNLLSIELARLHSMAVDFPKTGERIPCRYRQLMYKARSFPRDFDPADGPSNPQFLFCPS
jgi:hypothetical protein